MDLNVRLNHISEFIIMLYLKIKFNKIISFDEFFLNIWKPILIVIELHHRSIILLFVGQKIDLKLNLDFHCLNWLHSRSLPFVLLLSIDHFYWNLRFSNSKSCHIATLSVDHIVNICSSNPNFNNNIIILQLWYALYLQRQTIIRFFTFLLSKSGEFSPALMLNIRILFFSAFSILKK
jgi:hypothetical protein